MNERKLLIDLCFEAVGNDTCEICKKMGWKCKVKIPENADFDTFHPDFEKCDFKENYYKVLTLTNNS